MYSYLQIYRKMKAAVDLRFPAFGSLYSWMSSRRRVALDEETHVEPMSENGDIIMTLNRIRGPVVARECLLTEDISADQQFRGAISRNSLMD